MDELRTGTANVLTYTLRDTLRGRGVAGYALFFAAVSAGLLRFGGGLERALPSLASVTLLVVPLVSVLFAAIALYEGRDFIELVLSHPVGRRPLFLALYLGLALPLATAFCVGTVLPLALHGLADHAAAAIRVVLGGVLLTLVFTAIGCWVALRVAETARGLGLALLLWLALTVLYDGAVLLGAHTFAAWPLERPLLLAMILNPVDLARVLALLALDASALTGYTGAVFQRFFGSAVGVAVAVGALLAWIALPVALALRRFERMDL
ncbi:MAG: ABC transporter permease subunit [Gemmatimonadota bacterium]